MLVMGITQHKPVSINENASKSVQSTRAFINQDNIELGFSSN